MKNLFQQKHVPTLVAASVFLVSSLYSQADDLEIYTSVTNSANSAAANHNILFVMDTSGSMDWSTAGLASEGAYDPLVTYGSSTGVYVYDTDFVYTGINFSETQNQCQVMKDGFSTHASYPVFLDQAFQWHQIGDVIPAGEACGTPTTIGSPETVEGTVTKNGDNKTAFLIDEIVDYGTPYSITVSTDNKNIEITARTYEYRNGGYDFKTFNCKDTPINSANDYKFTCSGILGSDANNVDVRFTTKEGGKTKVTYSAVVNGSITTTCTTATDSIVTANDWKSTLINSSKPGSILECRKDAGTHGTTTGSDYVSECPLNTTCAAPKYTDTSVVGNAETEISWSTSPAQYFIKGNYHDFLTTPGSEDLTALPTADAQTYCTGDSNKNYNLTEPRFIDSKNGFVYQCFRRLDVMKDAVNNLVVSLAAAPINIGLMRFNSDSVGGTVVNAVQNITTNTDFTTKLNALPASGGTPLSETLYEAYRYMGGQTKNQGGSNTDSAAIASGTYKTPITESCQSNNIIFLSDGEPSNDKNKNETIRNLAKTKHGGSSYTCIGKYADGTTEPGSDTSSGVCLDEIAGVLANTDMRTDVPGNNTVKTFTIGLATDLAILQDTALDGGGDYFTAASLTDLEKAFQTIVVDILTDAASFVAPAVSVNAFNELQHRNEVYYALFEPSGTPRWPGNVKKYTVNPSGDILDLNDALAVDFTTGFFKETAKSIWSADVDGKSVTLGGAASNLTNTRKIYTDSGALGVAGTVIDLETSNFNTIPFGNFDVANDAQKDMVLNWLLGIDVYDDNKNGDTAEAAKFLGDPLHSRPIVVTYAGTSAAPQEVLFYSSNLGTLHAIDPNTALGTELWAYLPKEHQGNLDNYITAPNSLEHTYGLDGEMTIVSTEAVGSTSANFSLASVQLYLGERRGGNRYYGFDVSNARKEASTPLLLVDATTDPTYTEPFKKLWTITGGTGADATAGFSDLGETWSKMVPTTLKYNGGSKEVLIFSGGYDDAHDVLSHTSTDAVSGGANAISDQGNAIYVIEAATGTLLYSIGNNSDDDDSDPANAVNSRNIDQHKLALPMQSSIPATPTVIDVDGDGDVDLIFAIDIEGHVWRIDVDESKALASNDLMGGGMIADLSTASDQRRFYNSIDASRSSANSGSDHINLVVGSGFRAGPSTDEAVSSGWNNRIYFLFDDYPTKRNLDGAPEADRYKYASTTAAGTAVAKVIEDSDLSLSTTGTPMSKTLATHGFYISLSDGEKVLQKSITFNNVVLVSTFNIDSGAITTACGGSLGAGRVYALDITNGTSVLTDGDEDNTQQNYVDDGGTVDEYGNAVDADGNALVDADGQAIRFNSSGQRIVDYYELKHQGIPAESTLLLLPELAICIGTECNIDTLEDALLNGFETGQAYRSFWLEK